MPRLSPQSSFLNLPLLIIIIPTIAILIFLFFAFPFLPSQRTHRSSTTTTSNCTVKKGWDSLNVLLVLFAILCGLFAKRNDDESTNRDPGAESNELNDTNTNTEERQNQWFDQSLTGPKKWDNPTPLRRLKRNSSSYPDLRQESLLETDNYRFRFFDDFDISMYRQFQASSVSDNPSPEKEIPVDTLVLHSTPPRKSPPPSPPPPPPPPLPMTPNLKSKWYNNPVSQRKAEIKAKSPPPPPPLPPPRQAAAKEGQSERRNERKRNNATKEIKMVLASLYNGQRKRKRKPKPRNFISTPEVSISAQPPPSLPPPPPPPPPPPSVFHSLFRKGGKSKRIHSFSAPPPPPPPPVSRRKVNAPPPAPPPPAPRTPSPENSNRRRSFPSWRPPLPSAARANTLLDDYEISSGGQSPLIPIPPPPPPFKVPGFRFVVKGDFVKVRSANSSRCSSPELEESTEEANSMEGGADDGGVSGGGGPVFCASPDVNVKADTFIARLREGWRLENSNSLKQRDHLGLGPDYFGPGPS